MSALRAVYVDQLKNLRRMSDHIGGAVADLVDVVADDDLSKRLQESNSNFLLHSKSLGQLSTQAGDEKTQLRRRLSDMPSRRTETSFPGGASESNSVIARGRQMCQSGLGAFSTVKAIAESLGDDGSARALSAILVDIHDLDGLISGLSAETLFASRAN